MGPFLGSINTHAGSRVRPQPTRGLLTQKSIMTRYLKYATTLAVTAAVLALPSLALTQEATEILEIVAPADTPTKTVDINVAGSLELQAGMWAAR